MVGSMTRKSIIGSGLGVLVGLEADVVKTLGSIKNGIALLDGRRAALVAEGSENGTDSHWESEAGEPVDTPR